MSRAFDNNGVLTGVTQKDIWKYLGMQKYASSPYFSPKELARALGCPVSELEGLTPGDKGPLDSLLELVPDEFDAWVRGVVEFLEEKSRAMIQDACEEYRCLHHLCEDRGEFARAAQRIEDKAVRAAVFLILDGNLLGLHVWRAIKPQAVRPFKEDEETGESDV